MANMHWYTYEENMKQKFNDNEKIVQLRQKLEATQNALREAEDEARTNWFIHILRSNEKITCKPENGTTQSMFGDEIRIYSYNNTLCIYDSYGNDIIIDKCTVLANGTIKFSNYYSWSEGFNGVIHKDVHYIYI